MIIFYLPMNIWCLIPMQILMSYSLFRVTQYFSVFVQFLLCFNHFTLRNNFNRNNNNNKKAEERMKECFVVCWWGVRGNKIFANQNYCFIKNIKKKWFLFRLFCQLMYFLHASLVDSSSFFCSICTRIAVSINTFKILNRSFILNGKHNTRKIFIRHYWNHFHHFEHSHTIFSCLGIIIVLFLFDLELVFVFFLSLQTNQFCFSPILWKNNFLLLFFVLWMKWNRNLLYFYCIHSDYIHTELQTQKKNCSWLALFCSRFPLSLVCCTLSTDDFVTNIIGRLKGEKESRRK